MPKPNSTGNEAESRQNVNQNEPQVIAPDQAPAGNENENNAPQIQNPAPSIKNVPGGITFENFKDMALTQLHLDPVLVAAGQAVKPSDEELMSRFHAIQDDELVSQYNAYLDNHRTRWEQNAKSALPLWVRNTGNVTLLSDFMNDPNAQLTYEQKHFLKNVMKSSGRAAENLDRIDTRIKNGEPPLERKEAEISKNENGSDNILLKDVHQKDYQTSNNGCWSCFFQVLASSKGLDITQEEIRDYRPDLSKSKAESVIAGTDKAYNTDAFNNAVDMGDSILSFMPNTMLSEFSVSGYTPEIAEETGLTAEQYAQAAYEKIKKTLVHALKDERSPVGITSGKHFLTIVGIDGDKIKYKNSQQEVLGQEGPDVTHERTIQELFGDVLEGKLIERRGLDFIYATDIKLSKDGKTLFGVPSDHVSLSENGKVEPQPTGIRLAAGLPAQENQINRKGIQVARMGRVEDTYSEQVFRNKAVDNVVFYERVYMPKQLNMAYLKSQAENRKLKEEEELRQIDREALGMDRKKLTSADIVLDKANKIADRPNIGSVQVQHVSADDTDAFKDSTLRQQVVRREEAAKQRIHARVEPTRTQGLVNGFKAISEGKHPELRTIQYLTDADYKLEKVTKIDMKSCEKMIEPIFGTDINGTSVIDIHAVLDKFTYKKTPESEPVNLVDDVKERIKNLPIYVNAKQGDKNDILYQYVKIELMHLALTGNAELKYDNGDYSIEKVTAIPPKQSVMERLTEISSPVNEIDKRMILHIKDMGLPKVTNANLYEKLIGLDQAQIDKCVKLYDKLFHFPHPGDMLEIEYKLKTSPDDAQPISISFSDYMKEKRNGKVGDALYNPEVWSKELIKDGKRIKATEPKNNTPIIKATVILALVNGIDMSYHDQPLPSPKAALEADDLKKKQAVESMTSPNLTFSPSNGKTFVDIGNTISSIQHNITNMLAEVESHDETLIRSSKKFRKMKEELKKLDKLVNVKWAEKIEKGEPVTFEMLDEFVQKNDKLQQRISDYLDYKENQMLKDPARRNAPDKQGYEQKRIATNIKMLGALQTLNKNVTKSVMQGITAGAKDVFRRELENERIRRADMNITPDEYQLSSMKSFYKMSQLEDKYYERRQLSGSTKETLTQLRDRIARAVNEKPTLKQLESEIGKFGRTADLSAETGTFYTAYQYSGERMSDDKMQQIYKESTKLSEWNAQSLNPDSDRIKNYQRKLLADTPDRLLTNAEGDRTQLSPKGLTGVLRAESLFGPTPYVRDEMVKANFFTAETIQTLKPLVIDRFKAIGAGEANGNGNRKISDKDFAAIAFAAGYTPRAHDKIDERIKHPDLEISRKDHCHKYTSHLGSTWAEGRAMGKNLDPYIGAIAASRDLAYDALVQYNKQPPNKEPLAHLLKTGISYITKSEREGFNGIQLESEMLARMADMLNRDPELKELAFLDGLTQSDIDFIDSMKVYNEIKGRGEYARDALRHTALPLTREDRIEMLTDQYLQEMINTDVYKAKEARNNTKDYQNAVTAKKLSFSKELAKPQNKDKQLPAHTLEWIVDATIQQRMPTKCALAESLGKPGVYQALRSSVKEMIESTYLCGQRSHFTKDLDTIHRTYGLSNLLKDYKKSPINANGKYDIEALINKKLEADAAKKAQAKKDVSKDNPAIGSQS